MHLSCAVWRSSSVRCACLLLHRLHTTPLMCSSKSTPLVMGSGWAAAWFVAARPAALCRPALDWLAGRLRCCCVHQAWRRGRTGRVAGLGFAPGQPMRVALLPAALSAASGAAVCSSSLLQCACVWGCQRTGGCTRPSVLGSCKAPVGWPGLACIAARPPCHTLLGRLDLCATLSFWRAQGHLHVCLRSIPPKQSCEHARVRFRGCACAPGQGATLHACLRRLRRQQQAAAGCRLCRCDTAACRPVCLHARALGCTQQPKPRVQSRRSLRGCCCLCGLARTPCVLRALLHVCGRACWEWPRP